MYLIKRLIFGLMLLVLLASGIQPVERAQAATPLYVRTDGDDAACNGEVDAPASSAPDCAYATIQEAVDQVDSGGTVYVRNGLYIESNIQIIKSLSLIGESQAGVVIAPEAEDVGSGTSSFDGTYQHGIMITADNVEISQLTIDGDANNLANGGSLPDHHNFRIGILNYADGDEDYSNINIHHVTITNIRRRGVSIWPYGVVGIVVSDSTISYVENQQAIYSSADQIVISNNDISYAGSGVGLMPNNPTPGTVNLDVLSNNFHHIGGAHSLYYGHSWPSTVIYYRNPNVDQTITIQNNTLSIGDGAEAPGFPGVLGMYIYNADAASSISNNSLDSTAGLNNWGIYLGGCAGTTVSGNSFTMNESDSGIYLGRGISGTPVPNEVTNNDFISSASTSSNISEGVAILQSDHGDVFWMTEVPFDTSSVITGNTISGFVYGIRFDTEGLYTVQSVVQENIITENTTVGLLASTALQVSGSFDLMVSQNCIYNNATGLTWQDPAVSLDARNNYWGSALGPTHPSNATGDGDVITGDVNFVPWLNSCQLLPTPTPTATATATATMTSTPEPTATGSPGDLGSTLPDTGFAPGLMTDLGVPETHYFDLMSGYVSGGGMSLIIPTLGVSSPVLGVPANETGWNVRWLGNYVGWLAGSAFPTWEGNTVLTGHVYNSTGEAGVFVNLNRLSWGDRIVIEAWGQEHVYEVRSVKYVASDDVRSVMQHEEQDWLTLVTCYGFNEATGKFDLRVVVRAIRID